MRLYKKKHRGRIIVTVISVAIVLVAVYVYETRVDNNPTDVYIRPGYTVVRGNQTASDGRILIQLGSYRADDAADLFPNDYTLNPRSIFFMVNATIANVGGGNTTISSSFYTYFWNGSGIMENGQAVENASFPRMFPSQSYPVTNGGLFLPPGTQTTIWLFFYVPHSESLDLNGFRSQAKLLDLVYFENTYGGDYLGNGVYTGNFYNPKIEFIIKP